MTEKRARRYLKRGSLYLIRLQTGEGIIESLTAFCQRHKIKAAVFQGIGTCCRAELGYFRLSKKSYSFRTFRGDYEIASLQGNVSLLAGKPFVHAHIVLGGPDFASRSGHLKEALVQATCEVVLRPLPSGLRRKPDPATGLNLWDWASRGGKE